MLSQSEVSSILKDIALSSTWIDQFQTMTPSQQQVALNGARNQLLYEIHQSQAKLECLDYLRYQLK